MKRLRFSFASLMLGIGILALNLAMGRVFWSRAAWLTLRVLPCGIILQITLIRLVRRGGGAFHAGFVLFGTLAAFSYAWGAIFGERSIMVFSTTGEYLYTTPQGLLGGPQMSNLWLTYIADAGDILEKVPPLAPVVRGDWFSREYQFLLASLLFFAQLSIALIGGLLFLGITRLAGLRRRREPQGASSG